MAGGLVPAWPDRSLSISGASNEVAASCDLVVVATPWDSAVATVKPLASTLAGKVVVSMANALVKEGREFLALDATSRVGGGLHPGGVAPFTGVGGLPSSSGFGDGEADHAD